MHAFVCARFWAPFLFRLLALVCWLNEVNICPFCIIIIIQMKLKNKSDQEPYNQLLFLKIPKTSKKKKLTE